MLLVAKMGISQTECSLTCPMIANGWALFYRYSGPFLGYIFVQVGETESNIFPERPVGLTT